MATVQPSQPWFKANWRLPRREQNVRICAPMVRPGGIYETAPNGGYARASYASGGGGASRVPRIAGDVTAGFALVSCVLVSYAPCAERRRF